MIRNTKEETRISDSSVEKLILTIFSVKILSASNDIDNAVHSAMSETHGHNVRGL